MPIFWFISQRFPIYKRKHQARCTSKIPPTSRESQAFSILAIAGNRTLQCFLFFFFLHKTTTFFYAQRNHIYLKNEPYNSRKVMRYSAFIFQKYHTVRDSCKHLRFLTSFYILFRNTIDKLPFFWVEGVVKLISIHLSTILCIILAIDSFHREITAAQVYTFPVKLFHLFIQKKMKSTSDIITK